MDEQNFVIKPDQISKEALDNIIEAFILREGTNYGSEEFSLKEKKKQVLLQITEEKVLILYDQENESINLMTQRDFKNQNSD